jgi:hypothetical protein
LLLCGIAVLTARAETFKLTTGQEISGEMLIASANDQGVQIKVGEGDYQRVPWANFTQEDLRRFAQNPKMQPLVEPWIEITPEERIKQTEVKIKDPPRLSRPPGGSLLGAMFSSGVGLFLLFAIYGANIYAGYEVALFRARPPLLVAGLAAIPFLGIVVPILFLALPTKIRQEAALLEAPAEPSVAPPQAATAAPVGASDALNPMQAEGVQHPAGLKLAHEEKPSGPSLPQTVTYQRGQFTFNRRFFETKFPNFFGVVRREADKDMMLVIKGSRGEFHGERISRIAANDLHLQVRHGNTTEEVMIPFQEIQEVRFQHKDAKK